MQRAGAIGEMLARHLEQRPDAVALYSPSGELTFEELEKRSNQVAHALKTSGIEPADRVAYLGKNVPEYLELFLGAAKAGAIVVPLNWRLAVPELDAIIADATPKILVAEHESAAKAVALNPGNGSLKIVTVNDGQEFTPAPSTSTQTYTAWLQIQPTLAVDVDVDPGSVVLLVYTSGTTGRPKGVMNTHDALERHFEVLAEAAAMTAGGVSLCTLPAFHIGGTSWSLAGLWAGCETIIFREVDPAQILQTIGARRTTTMIAVPAVIQMLLESDALGQTDFSSLDRLYYGGGPISPAVLGRALDRFDCEFVQGFGMTECALVTTLEPGFHSTENLLLSCGLPVPDTEVRIVDSATCTDVAVGEVGEMWVRSPRVMAGYWNQPDATSRALTDDGWLRTGDAARIDGAGFYYIQDRIKDMIVTGGENVYSAEVENALMAHPFVAECAVIGVPSQRWTETVKAFVVLRPGSDANENDLIDFCRERLARYKCPTSVAFEDSLPRTPAGKLRKYELRSRHWSTP
jgi:long-chain acyl-CoA synthetase